MRKKKDDRRRRRDRRSRIEEEKKDESEQSSVIETFKISQCSASGILARSTSSLHTFFFCFSFFLYVPAAHGLPTFLFSASPQRKLFTRPRSIAATRRVSPILRFCRRYEFSLPLSPRNCTRQLSRVTRKQQQSAKIRHRRKSHGTSFLTGSTLMGYIPPAASASFGVIAGGCAAQPCTP